MHIKSQIVLSSRRILLSCYIYTFVVADNGAVLPWLLSPSSLKPLFMLPLEELVAKGYKSLFWS